MTTNGADINPDIVVLVLEVNRLERGGQPHGSDSPQTHALNCALHRCSQSPETVGLAAVARKAITAAARAAMKEPT